MRKRCSGNGDSRALDQRIASCGAEEDKSSGDNRVDVSERSKVEASQ